ncbi:MAG TPA: P1 family peptidase [Actinomycetes bacterium]
MRARELGIEIGPLAPGPADAITDVAGVRVGHTTVIEGDDVRTGVTVVLPHGGNPGTDPVFAGCHTLNGRGELTGLEWVRESGLLSTPVGLTNTCSVGVVRDALIAADVTDELPVVGETWDGRLNDIRGMHVRAEHVHTALATAAEEPDGAAVAEGAVGGGTGMVCHGFKGGIGTASRVLADEDGGYTVGVLVQANHGRRQRLRVDGLPVGELIGDAEIPLPRPQEPEPASSSIIVVVATDAPLLPGQCARVAQRAGFGIARTGGAGEHTSGDFILAFATGNRGLGSDEHELPLRMVADRRLTPMFYAAIDATEEAILNAMLAARTMSGNGSTVSALTPEALAAAMTHLGHPPSPAASR